MTTKKDNSDDLLRKLGGWAIIALGSYTVWASNTFFTDFNTKQASITTKLTAIENTTSRIDERTIEQGRRILRLEDSLTGVIGRDSHASN